MFAVIKTGGKQYIVAPGQKLKIEKLPQKEGDSVVFNEVLLVDNDPSTSSGQEVKIGTPFVKGAVVEGKVVKHGKGEKIIVFQFKNKKREKKKKGHRQLFTEIEIEKIVTQ